MEGFKKKSREDRVSAPLQLSTVEQFYNEGPRDRQNLLAIKRFCHNEVLLYFTISGLPLIRKLKIPWVFTDLLNSFHRPFINEKQSMFTFDLAFFAGHQYFSLHFQPLTAICRKRKKEFGRKHSEGKPLTSTTTCVRRRVSNWSLCLLCSTVFIFSEGIFISKSWGKLMNYKPENRISWLFTDFDNIKDFPWLFPDLEKFSFFPDFSLTVATLYFLGEE